MVARCGVSFLLVHNCCKPVIDIGRKLVGSMNDNIVFDLGVVDIGYISIWCFQVSFVSNLTTALWVKRCDIENQLKHITIFIGDFSVTNNPHWS